MNGTCEYANRKDQKMSPQRANKNHSLHILRKSKRSMIDNGEKNLNLLKFTIISLIFLFL